MKRFLLICIAIAITPILSADAFSWSGLSNFFNAAATTTKTEQQTSTFQTETLNTLKAIQEQTDAVDKSVQNNFINIVSLLSTKKETNSIKSQLESIITDTNKTDTEKTQLLNNLLVTYATSLSNNTSTTKTLGKLSASQKLELIKQITSIEQSGQKYADLAKQAITCSASSVFKASTTNNSGITADDIAAIITQTNQTTSLIKEKAANTINLANQFRTIAQTAGIVQ